jgi:putative phosphoesterase
MGFVSNGMKIGLISDTHDNLPKLERAVQFFNKNKVNFVLHAGDYVAPFAIDKLNALSCDWIGVFGNNDGEKKGLSAKSGNRIKESPYRFELFGRKITLAHDPQSLEMEKEPADLIVFGHTHQPEVIKLRDKLIVNPGECSGWVSDKSTVGIVDMINLTAAVIKI